MVRRGIGAILVGSDRIVRRNREDLFVSLDQVKRVLATVVLSAGVLNRAAMAEQLLDMLRVNGPPGTYLIEADTAAGSLVPPKDEDWRFDIVVEVQTTSTLTLKTSPIDLPVLDDTEGQK